MKFFNTLKKECNVIIIILYILIITIFSYSISKTYLKKEYYEYMKYIKTLENENIELKNELKIYKLNER
jgi:hypothetical protein